MEIKKQKEGLKQYLNEDSKKFYKQAILLAIPILIQDLVRSSANLLDQLMIGSLGVESITAVGICAQVSFVFLLLVFGAASGAGVFVGQFYGRQKEGYDETANIRKTVGISMFLGLTVAFIYSVIVLFFPRLIISPFTDDENVMKIAIQYIRITIPSNVLLPIGMSLSAAVRGMGQTKLPTVSVVVALLINLILNYTFIYILHLGVAGAAVSTSIARFVEVIVLIVLIKKQNPTVYTSIKNYFSFDRAYLKQYLKTALPIILNEAGWALGVSLYVIAYSTRGTEAQASVMIANSIKNFFFVFSFSIGSASGIIIGNTLGANKIELAKYEVSRIIFLILNIGVVFAFVFIAVTPVVLMFYNVSDAVVSSVIHISFIYAILMLIQVYTYTGIVGILRAGGDTRFCMLADILTVWCVAVPLVFIGAYFTDLPIEGLVALASMEEFVKIFFVRKRINSEVWAKNIVNTL